MNQLQKPINVISEFMSEDGSREATIYADTNGKFEVDLFVDKQYILTEKNVPTIQLARDMAEDFVTSKG